MAQLNCCFLTINCGGAAVNDEYLAISLSAVLHKQSRDVDLIFVALQELAPAPYSLLGGSLLSDYLSKISSAIEKTTTWSGHSPLQLVQTCVMGFVAGVLYARPAVADRLKDVKTATTALGQIGIGNKAAVGLRFDYVHENDVATNITFVAAHLMHGEENCARRNQDWQDINQHLVFQGASSDADHARPSVHPTPLAQEHEPLVPKDNPQSMFSPGSYLFFGGDLNYRVSDTAPDQSAIATFPQPGSPMTNFENDQLSRERAAGRTLHGLSEEHITFGPTYKFSPEALTLASKDAEGLKGTTERASNSQDSLCLPTEPEKWHWAAHRWPSWTDRVLYLKPSTPDLHPIIHEYTSLPIQPTTDHRPVVLFFSIPLRRITDAEKAQWPKAPFALKADWALRRNFVRCAEILIGAEAYLLMTGLGRAMLVVAGLSVFSAWYLYG